MRTPPLLVIASLVAPLSACNLDIKHCIGDCTPLTGGPGDSGDSGGDPTAGEDLGGELGSCELVDTIPSSTHCNDGVAQPGEVCYVGTLGVIPPSPITSSVAVPMDGRFGVLTTTADDAVIAHTFGPGTSDTKHWPQPLTTSPQLRASGDFDEDGIVDAVATTQTFAEGILIRALLLDGEGGLGDAKLVRNSESVITLDAVDWNGDGHLDIVTVFTADPGVDNFAVLLGDGTGEFTETLGPIIPQPKPGYVLGALDADGRPDDFVFTETGSGRIVRHDGGAQTQTAPGMPAELWFHDWLIGDLDGDGLGDLVGVATHMEHESSEAVVFFQLENGDFPHDPVRYPVHCGARLGALGDLDGDGLLDLVTAGNQGFATYRRGDGAGNFVPVKMLPFDKLEEGDAFFVADFQGDGTADLAGTSFQNGWLSFMPNRP